MTTATTEIRHAWSANPSGVRRRVIERCLLMARSRFRNAIDQCPARRLSPKAKEANVRGPPIVPVPFLFGRAVAATICLIQRNNFPRYSVYLSRRVVAYDHPDYVAIGVLIVLIVWASFGPLRTGFREAGYDQGSWVQRQRSGMSRTGQANAAARGRGRVRANSADLGKASHGTRTPT